MVVFVTVLLAVISCIEGSKQYNGVTPEQVSSFPTLFHLDEYDKCLAKRGGLYCLGTFELRPTSLPHPQYKLMKIYTSNNNYNRTRIHRGYCVSERCPAERGQNTSLRFERCANKLSEKRSLKASLLSLEYCRTHKEAHTKQPQTEGQRLFIQAIYVILLLNFIGTVYDVLNKNPKKNKWLSSFSVVENWRRFTTVYVSGDPRLRNFNILNGGRVCILAIVMYGHAIIFSYLPYRSDPEHGEEFLHGTTGIYMANGSSIVQVFATISSLVTVYNLLIISENHDLSLRHLPLVILKRVVRILPVNVFIIAYAATWWEHSRDGPLASMILGKEGENCRHKFWSHVFFYNNIVEPEKLCVASTWFLAADMHNYILLCAITLVMWRRRIAALKLFTFLFVASCALVAVVSYVKGYKPIMFIAYPENIRHIFRYNRSVTELYLSSWGCLSSSFLGAVLAHVLYEVQVQKIDLAQNKWFFRSFCITTPLLLIWNMTSPFFKQFSSPISQALLLGVERQAMGFLIAYGFLASHFFDSLFHKLFNNRVYDILTKMSLTVMLLHWCIMMTIMTRPVAFAYSSLDVLLDYISANVLTYALAVPITLLLEMPTRRCFNMII